MRGVRVRYGESRLSLVLKARVASLRGPSSELSRFRFAQSLQPTFSPLGRRVLMNIPRHGVGHTEIQKFRLETVALG